MKHLWYALSLTVPFLFFKSLQGKTVFSEPKDVSIEGQSELCGYMNAFDGTTVYTYCDTCISVGKGSRNL